MVSHPVHLAPNSLKVNRMSERAGHTKCRTNNRETILSRPLRKMRGRKFFLRDRDVSAPFRETCRYLPGVTLGAPIGATLGATHPSEKTTENQAVKCQVRQVSPLLRHTAELHTGSLQESVPSGQAPMCTLYLKIFCANSVR